MSTIILSLPEEMKAFVEEQARKGGFGTVSEYIWVLIRLAQRRDQDARIDALLIKSLDPGPATPPTKSDWADIRREVLRRHFARQADAYGTEKPGGRLRRHGESLRMTTNNPTDSLPA